MKDPKIIVALDYDSIEPVREFVVKLDPSLCRLKVGNILFTRYGPALVEELMRAGFEVFLDLKFHDIPQTVAGACRSSAELGVWMVNLHVSGGRAMMNAAREMVDKCQHKPLLIGVSVLTSLEQADFALWGVESPIEELVLKMANEAKVCGFDGLVCSSQEAQALRQALGDAFVLVTPGIRLIDDAADDQKRIMTPEAAIAAGSSYLVIGRSITKAQNPLAKLKQINEMIAV